MLSQDHYHVHHKIVEIHKLKSNMLSWIGFFSAPILAIVIYLILPDTYQVSNGKFGTLTYSGKITAAVAVWMAVWWMSEAIPVYATALLPLVLLPVCNAVPIRIAASSYAHELIFLFMGGFMIELSMERWNLHKRIAYIALLLVGTKPVNIVGGFMIITAILSMWVSNTATTIMMLPIALSIINLVAKEQTGETIESPKQLQDPQMLNFSLSLLLGIAYAASIGGVGTLIGTPPNLFLASYVKNQMGIEISFVKWMAVALPLVLVFLPITWIVLTRLLYPFKLDKIVFGSKHIKEELNQLGAMKPGEWITFIVFMSTATAWIIRPMLMKLELFGIYPFSGLSDPVIAMIAAITLFVTPVDFKNRIFTINWETAVKLPWGLLILFGGGLSLAAAIQNNGVGEFIGNQVGSLNELPPLVLVLTVTATMIILTELTSNTATTATLVPILASVAPGLGLHPFILIIPATIAASCAFMLPVATPPNAIVFGSGFISIRQMCKTGIYLNIVGIILIVLLTYTIALKVLGVDF